ncbi:hypothetical protein J7K03_01920 [bacterium]|nr:hypothetical protein [bacterium]
MAHTLYQRPKRLSTLRIGEKSADLKVVNRILKRLTPERIQKEIKTIQRIKLPFELEKWVKEYEKVGSRDDFFWKWLYRANQVVTLPGISSKYIESLRRVKTLFNMFLALLDDIADESLNKKLLEQLLRVPFEEENIDRSKLNHSEREYLDFTNRLFRYIEKRIKKYPRYQEIKDVFEFDVRQLLNSMRYSYLVNVQPYIINRTEYWMYCSHNMQAMIDLTLDLMCFLKFPLRNLGRFREIAWQAQRMARIGNWISTWEREINKDDLTSGVIAYAIEKGFVNPASIHLEKTALIRKIKSSNIENYFLKEWENSYQEIRKLGKKMSVIDIQNFLKRLEKLLLMHLMSRGYK